MSSFSAGVPGEEPLRRNEAPSASVAVKRIAPEFAKRLQEAKINPDTLRKGTVFAPEDAAWTDFPWDELAQEVRKETLMYHFVTSDTLTLKDITSPSFTRNIDASGRPIGVRHSRGGVYVESGSGDSSARVGEVIDTPSGVTVFLIDAVLKPSVF